MIPDYQALMRPVLQAASKGEIRISDIVVELANQFGLTEDERNELLPSGKQTRFSNRVHWARGYLKQAGLVKATKRAHITITDRGREALTSDAKIDTSFLERYPEFQEFRSRTRSTESADSGGVEHGDPTATPDELLRSAHNKITAALATELIERIREASPAFFEQLIIDLLLAMGYGGSSEDAGRALGQSNDNGVDGVIDQDPLGVDQIYLQAKRYADGNSAGSAAIRDFFGALSLAKASKGIFVTTSTFSLSAIQTAQGLGSRIVLIDGEQLARLLIRYNIGCRDEQIIYVKKIDEDFFA